MRWLVLAGCLLTCAASAADGTSEPTSDTEAHEQASPGAHLQLTGALLGEFVGRGLGGELRASAGVGRLLDLGAGASLGSSTGILLTARLHLPWDEHSLVRPFAQLRAAVHPATKGYGGGLFTGVLVEAGPGRFELGAAGHLYAPVPGYLGYAVFAMAGYEFDAYGVRERGSTGLVEKTITHEKETVRETVVKEIVGATLIRGKVHDMDDQPLPKARVTLAGPRLPSPLQSTGVEFSFPVEAGEYTLTAEVEGFYLRGVHTTIKRGEQLVFSLPLRPMSKIKVVELTRKRVEIKQSIQFESNAARILPESFFILDAVVDTLLRNPQVVQVRVEGHTDNVGGAEFNQNLSETRAASVVKYLVEAGVDPARLQAQGFGLTKPVSDNKTEAGRAKNRRVQFELVE